MKSFLISAILTLLISSCNETLQSKVPLTDTIKHNPSNTNYSDTTKKHEEGTGQKALDTLPNILLGKMILVSSGQILPYITVKIDGCNFDLVTRDKDTVYLATTDKKFKTLEGYKTGTNFSELPTDIQVSLTKEPGWGYYYKLSSGWALGFCEGNSCTDNYPHDSSKVKWVFKRS